MRDELILNCSSTTIHLPWRQQWQYSKQLTYKNWRPSFQRFVITSEMEVNDVIRQFYKQQNNGYFRCDYSRRAMTIYQQKIIKCLFLTPQPQFVLTRKKKFSMLRRFLFPNKQDIRKSIWHLEMEFQISKVVVRIYVSIVLQLFWRRLFRKRHRSIIFADERILYFINLLTKYSK